MRWMKLDQIRKTIAKEVIDFIRNPTRTCLVLKTFTGSGKTTTTLQAIDSEGMRWIYAAPTHDIIDENIKFSSHRSFDFLHLKSRDKCCLNNDYKHLAGKGLDISFYCSKCGFFKEKMCEYDENNKNAYSKVPNLAITHAHIQNFLPNFLESNNSNRTIRGQYDVIIVDENPIKCFINETSVDYNAMSYFRECLVRFDMNKVFIKAAELLLEHELDYEKLMRISMSQINFDRENKRFSFRIGEAYINDELNEIPVNLIPFLYEIFSRKTANSIKHMIYLYKGKINLAYFNSTALNLGMKIIALDGTADKSVWEHMLNNNNIEIFPIDYQYENAYQLNDHRYPISSWKKGDVTAKNLCALIDKIAEKKRRKVLIVGTKYVHFKASKFLQTKNHEFATYYNLRSRNSYWKHCDTVILACEPNPPQEKINRCVALSGWNENIWRRIFREEEMLQAIGRLRQNIPKTEDGEEREKLEVYILPWTGVTGYCSYLLKEANVLSKDNLLYMLECGDFFKERLLYENIILSECPTNPTKIRDKYHYSYEKTKRYFLFLEREGYITKIRSGLYDITERGLAKLSPKTKETKGIIGNPIYTK
jgi:hypothetical protein